MKYALVADLHGNIHALNAVLRDAKKNNVDNYIFLGDYYLSIPYPNKMADKLMEQKNAYFIKGNEEEYLELNFDDGSIWDDNGQFSAVFHTYNALTKQTKAFLNNLPKFYTIKDEHFDIFMFHSANDFFKNTYLNHVTPTYIATEKKHNPNIMDSIKSKLKEDYQLKEVVKSLPKGIYTFGHTHMQMHLEIEDSLLINPGSCGLPLDFSQNASYTILETTKNGWIVTEQKIKYDLELLIEEIKQTKLYNEASVWYNIIIEELIASESVVIPFLCFVDEYAQSIGDNRRPFTKKTWEDGYLKWINKKRPATPYKK